MFSISKIAITCVQPPGALTADDSLQLIWVNHIPKIKKH